jgi:hypothetical protein
MTHPQAICLIRGVRFHSTTVLRRTIARILLLPRGPAMPRRLWSTRSLVRNATLPATGSCLLYGTARTRSVVLHSMRADHQRALDLRILKYLCRSLEVALAKINRAVESHTGKAIAEPGSLGDGASSSCEASLLPMRCRQGRRCRRAVRGGGRLRRRRGTVRRTRRVRCRG